MEGETPDPQSKEMGAKQSEIGEPSTSSKGGCLIAFTAMALLFTLALVSCAVMIGPSRPDEKLDHTQLPSPSGKWIASFDGYVSTEYFGGPAFYDVVTISEGGQGELVGWFSYGVPARWITEDKLLVTINRIWTRDVRSRVLGVDVIVHIGNELNVEGRRKELEAREAHDLEINGKLSRSACEDYRSGWEGSRKFWAWARKVADNGDPDPGPWVSKIYPADCSTLPGA